MEENKKRWRLILGQDVNENLGNPSLSQEQTALDIALSTLYDNTEKGQGNGGPRSAGLGSSNINISKWLGDVRSIFPTDIVSLIQTDAIEMKGLKSLLLEPESLANITPNISIVETLMALKEHIPKKSKETARELVRQVVEEITKRLEQDLKKAVIGALNKKEYSPLPNLAATDWKKTIQKNLKNYDTERNLLIPDKFYFWERRQKSKEWTVILDIDQSGSMAESIIYSSVMGAIFASMPSLDTHVVAFDTNVVNLTEEIRNDPVDILFGLQLGGGTDINKSVRYCSNLIENPKKTLFILISDLYEGGVESALLQKLSQMKEDGVKCLVLLALSDEGKPFYDEKLGKKISALGIPAFACSPDRLPDLIADSIKGKDLTVYQK